MDVSLRASLLGTCDPRGEAPRFHSQIPHLDTTSVQKKRPFGLEERLWAIIGRTRLPKS